MGSVSSAVKPNQDYVYRQQGGYDHRLKWQRYAYIVHSGCRQRTREQANSCIHAPVQAIA
jgi:hypothetical protein